MSTAKSLNGLSELSVCQAEGCPLHSNDPKLHFLKDFKHEIMKGKSLNRFTLLVNQTDDLIFGNNGIYSTLKPQTTLKLRHFHVAQCLRHGLQRYVIVLSLEHTLGRALPSNYLH